MIHTHFHRPAFRTEKEARLCQRENAERAREAVSAYQQMHENKDIVSARAQFDNPELRREYPQMTGKQPLDRSFFMALMMGSSLPVERKGYGDIERKDINISDPFRLAKKTNKEVGEWLSKNVQPAILKELDAAPKPTTEPELTTWLERMGQLYKDRMARGAREFARTGTFNDTLLSKVPLERYATIRKDLDALFRKEGIRVPGIDVDKSQLGDNNLTRREYLALLSLIWNDTEDIMGPLAVEAAKGVQFVRTFIKTKQPAPSEADRAYIDLSLEELGPSETLSGLGITVPVDLRKNYNNALVAREGDDPEYIETEAGPVLTGRPKIIINPEDSAATWDKYPARAYPFLSTHMAIPGTGNLKFLEAMRYYFVVSPSEQTKMDKPEMTEKDTRAMLHIISQMLVDSEKVLDKTIDQRVGFRDSLTLADKIENGAGDIFKYMLDIRKHPIGSAAMWMLAAGTIYGGYKFLTGKHKRGTKWLAYGALAGVAFGLYQQSRNGEAWWETVWNKANTLMGRERTKQPTEQTLPNYWAEELKMDSDKERVMLSLLGEGKVGDVMNWYKEMHLWKKRGSSLDESQPELPLNYDPKFDKFFGTATWDQRNEMFYTVMSKFLANRGRAVKTEYPDYVSEMKLEDDEAIGNAYIRDRYLEQTYVVSVISGIEKAANITIDIDGEMILNWNDNDPRLIQIKTEHPKIYATLFKIHQTYEQERQIRASEQWDMSTIFLLEANPETLRRMGRAGAEAASLLDVVYRQTTDALKYPFAGVPEDRAKKEDLFRGAEETLMNKLGERFLQKGDPDAKKTNEELKRDFATFMEPLKLPAGMKEKIMDLVNAFRGTGSILETIERARFEALVLEEWFEFLTRLPVDEAGKQKLAEFLPAFLGKNLKTPQVETLNEIERIKYQLLILAVKKNNRLDASILDKLDPKNDATWTVLFDRTVDVVWFDQAAFPAMESLTGLQSLFNSEAPEQGGAEWYSVFRAFPRWRQTNFTKLRDQITGYQNALARLRILPLIEPGKAPLDPKQINAIETQLARRIANRTLEALLLTHGEGFTPDLAGERTVSPIEQGNLAAYNDEIFRQILGKNADQINPNVALPTTLEVINNYVFNQLPNDTMQVLDKTGKVLHEYVWDPTQKFWVEKGFPWIKQRLDEADIIIGEGMNAAGEYIGWSVEQLSELWKNVAPILEKFPGETVRVVGEAGAATLIWLDATGKQIGEIAYTQYMEIKKAVYKVHGVPEDKFEAFMTKEKALEGYEHNGKNAKLRVSILGTKDVVIGQFNGIPDYSTYLNPVNIPYVGPKLPKQFDTSDFLKDGPFITVKVDDFVNRGSAELMKEWRDAAFAQKKNKFESAVKPPMKVQVAADPEFVEYDVAGMIAPRAKSSFYEFMTKPDGEIQSAFTAWMNKPGRVATDSDPFR